MAAAGVLRDARRAHRQGGDTAAHDQGQRTERRGLFHNVTNSVDGWVNGLNYMGLRNFWAITHARLNAVKPV
jgi:hypothetical protein